MHILRDVLQLLERGLVRCEHGEQGPEARGHRAEVYSLSHGRGGGGRGPRHGAPLPAQVCLLALQPRVRSFRCTLTSRLSLAVTHCFSGVCVCVFSSCAGRDAGHLSRTDAKHRCRCSLTHTLTDTRRLDQRCAVYESLKVDSLAPRRGKSREKFAAAGELPPAPTRVLTGHTVASGGFK